jgi:allene oxide cyclase-like protein
MTKRFGALSAAIAVVAFAAGVASPAAGSSNNDGREHHTIRFLGTVTELNLVDVRPQGASLGDEIVFSEKLTHGGHQIGHEGAVCTTVSLQRQEAQCVGTFRFPDGEITVQGLLNLGSPAPYSAPITGGSGKYQGAEGELHVRPISASQGMQTIYLQD